MSNLVYPVLPGLGYPVKRTPMNVTLVQETPYGFRTAIQQQQYARFKFGLTYNYLRKYMAAPSPNQNYSEVDALLGFFAQMAGRFDNFLYTDPEYNIVVDQVPVGTPPIGRVTLPLVTDGSFWYSPIRVPVGQYLALVTDLNPLNNSGLKVYANGVLLTAGADYTVQTGATSTTFSFAGLVIKFTGTPTGPITAAFSYYWRCAFAADDMDLDMFIHLLGKGVYKGQAVVFEQVFDNA